jgi:hypothetical protein
LGGERKMLVWNDLEPTEKVKIYDKGVELGAKQGTFDLYRSGDMWAPRVDQAEALQRETRYFVDCVEAGERRPLNDGRAGLRVVKILEAAQESLKYGGTPVSGSRLNGARVNGSQVNGSRVNGSRVGLADTA